MGVGAVWDDIVDGKKVEFICETPQVMSRNFETVEWNGRPEEGCGLALPWASTLKKED